MNIKSKLFHLSTIMMVAMVVSLFLSCGSDNENSGNPTGNIDLTVNGKQLVRINSTMLQYNSNGQLIKTKTLNDNSGSSETSYWYESKRIVVSPWNQIFKLGNGRIVGCEYTVLTSIDENAMTVDGKETYEYDNNGYLIKKTGPGVDYTEDGNNLTMYAFTWQNGNISKMTRKCEDDDSWEEHDISYTSYPNTIPFIFNDYGYYASYYNVYLSWQGYFGKRCKNLPAKDVVTRYNYSYPTNIIDRTTYTYDYTFEDGLVTKVVTKWTYNGTPSSMVYELEWY